MKQFAMLSLLFILFTGVSMAQVTLIDLKTELLTDPMGYGYAPLIADFNPPALAALLNKVRTGDDGFPAIVVRNPAILTKDVLEKAIDTADFKANPTAVDSAYFQSIMARESLALLDNVGADTFIFTNLKRLFGAGTATRTRLNALANRNGSRAEQLWGPGTTIGYQQVIDAIRLP